MGKTKNHPVVAEGKEYETITAFCAAYGLKYTTAVSYIKRGKTGDEVLALMGTLSSAPRYRNENKKACPCVFDGVSYNSLAAAADAYGVPPNMVYSIKNGRHISGEEALMRALQLKAEGYDLDEYMESRRRPVVVEGVRYPTKAAAAMAYGMPMITVQSRMARHGLTFQEALCMGKKQRRHIQAAQSLWTGQMRPFCKDTDDMASITDNLMETLRTNTYQPKSFYNETNQSGVIQITDTLLAISVPRDIYIVYKTEPNFLTLEFVIPELLRVRRDGDTAAARIFEVINRVNTKFTGARVVLQDDSLMASWSCVVMTGSSSIRLMMKSLHRFIGSAAGIYQYCSDCLEEDVAALGQEKMDV